jgi:hypothetical protein
MSTPEDGFRIHLPELERIAIQLDPPGPHTTCEVVAGTGSGQGVTVNASGSDNSVDWCAKAVVVAGFVVGSLDGQRRGGPS